MPVDRIPNQRAILARRALAEAVAAAVAEQGAGKGRTAVVAQLRGALAQGREELARRLSARPSAGHDCARGHAFLIDQLIG
jgi:[protein-PII] uridylyltransferase